MGIERVFVCDCCGGAIREDQYGIGAANWIQINGVQLNGVDNPYFCGECKPKIMNAVDKIVEEEAG